MTDLRRLVEETTRQRAYAIGHNTLRHLRHVRTTPPWSALRRPLEGVPAFIVGAGPSLDRAAPALAQAAQYGAVFAVNTSAPAVVRLGIPIDVLVLMESIDVSSHLVDVLPSVDVVALDLSAHDALWEATSASRRVWYAGPGPDNVPFLLDVDVPPLANGGATVTAAFQLAAEWGANPIVLVGHDLAFTAEDAYAKGAGWDGLRVERGADGRLMFAGRHDRDETHRRSGASPVPRNREAVEVAGWDGEQLSTTLDYYAQIAWYGRQPERWPDTYLANASVGGAAIPGWDHMPLGVVCHRCEPRPDRVMPSRLPYPVDGRRLDAAMARIRGGLDAAEHLATRVMDCTMPVAAHAICPYVETLIAPDLIGMKRARVPGPQRIEGVYVAIREAARRAREALDPENA